MSSGEFYDMEDQSVIEEERVIHRDATEREYLYENFSAFCSDYDVDFSFPDGLIESAESVCDEYDQALETEISEDESGFGHEVIGIHQTDQPFTQWGISYTDSDIVDSGFTIHFHVPEVSRLVIPGSDLWEYGRQNPVSLYLCDQNLPMFPQGVSERLSFSEDEYRFAITISVDFQPTYKAVNVDVNPSLVKLDQDFSVEEISKEYSDEKVLPDSEYRSVLDRHLEVSEKFFYSRVEAGETVVNAGHDRGNLCHQEVPLQMSNLLSTYFHQKFNIEAFYRVYPVQSTQKWDHVISRLDETGHVTVEDGSLTPYQTLITSYNDLLGKQRRGGPMGEIVFKKIGRGGYIHTIGNRSLEDRFGFESDPYVDGVRSYLCVDSPADRFVDIVNQYAVSYAFGQIESGLWDSISIDFESFSRDFYEYQRGSEMVSELYSHLYDHIGYYAIDLIRSSIVDEDSEDESMIRIER